MGCARGVGSQEGKTTRVLPSPTPRDGSLVNTWPCLVNNPALTTCLLGMMVHIPIQAQGFVKG
jgi:hypothetical protein